MEKDNNNKEKLNEKKINWKFCPNCGFELPNISNLKFCTNCGVNLIYIKQNKQLPPNYMKRQSALKKSIEVSDIGRYNESTGIFEKLTEEDLPFNKDTKLWSTSASIGLAISSFFIMNSILFVATFLMLLLIPYSLISGSILNNIYFIIFSSFSEFSLILLPIVYVRRYLQKPTLKNRLAIFGFTTKNYNYKQILKEIFFGLLFGFIGVISVLSISYLLEFILESIFGSNIIRNIGESSSGFDQVIANSDVLSIILLIIIMFIVIAPSEEILFRGFLQKGLVRSLSKKSGIIITAIIFTFIHLIGNFILYPLISIEFLISMIMSFIPYLVISLILGLIYEWRKENLIAPIITHAFYNSLTIMFVFFAFNFF
ncbi:MAG: CPBP family glutamic-type intramembrane protease [Promethearchaeota archaeon]